jgi:hemolysin III
MVSILAGPLEWLGLVLIWGMAAVGAARESPRLRTLWTLIFQMLLGGAALIPLLETLSRMSPMATFLVIAGGVVYLGGVTMFINSWPRLVPRVFSYHELFHVLVVVASVAHFVAVREVILSTQ